MTQRVGASGFLGDDRSAAFARVGGTLSTLGAHACRGLIYVRLCAFRISGTGRWPGWCRLEPRRNKYVDKYPPYLYWGFRIPAIKIESRSLVSPFAKDGPSDVRVSKAATSPVFFREIAIRSRSFIAVKSRPTATASDGCPLFATRRSKTGIRESSERPRQRAVRREDTASGFRGR